MCFKICFTGYMPIDIYINDTQNFVHLCVIYMTVCVLGDSERQECSYQISSIVRQGGVDPGYKGCGCVQDLIQRGRQDRHIHIAVMSKIVCKLLVFLGIIFVTELLFLKKKNIPRNI